MSDGKVNFFRIQDLPNVELYQTNGVSRAVPRHVHSVFSASVTTSGVRFHETRKGKYRVPPGAIQIVNIDEMHSSVPSDVPSTTRALRLLPEYLSTSLTEITGRRDGMILIRQPVIEDRELAWRLLDLQSILETSFSRLEKEVQLLAVFSLLNGRYSTEPNPSFRLGKENGPVLRACDYLQDCTAENVSLETLAAVAGLSPFHFSRVFTQMVGVPPHAYQLQLRLKKATDLLAAGCSATDVAYETGFCDQSHLQKVFKKKYGITPGQFGQIK